MNRVLILFSILLFSLVAAARDKKPRIVGQKSLQTDQGQSITIELSDLTVTDDEGGSYPDYPAGFSLEVFQGRNYVVSGQTITPDGNFAGALTVPVRVRHGNKKSDKFNLQITVLAKQSPTNIPPVIIGQVSLKTTQEKGITIRLSDLFVNDPDDPYPSGFTLKLRDGANYTRDGNTIRPANGFIGSLVVPAVVNDGKADSPPYSLQVAVERGVQNMAPVITGQNSVRTIKDQPVTITLNHLKVTDPDNKYPDDFTLRVFAGEHYSVSGAKVTPETGFVGTLSVNVAVSDGISSSNTFTITIPVVDNARLEIVGQSELEVLEDEFLELKPEYLQVNDPSKKYPTGFQIIIQAGENYSMEGTTIKPRPDYSGDLVIPLKVAEGARQSESYNLLVRVIPVNDAPVLTGVSAVPVIYDKDGAPTLIARNLGIEDPDNENLFMAEVGFETGYYQAGGDVLVPSINSLTIRAIFDAATGTLFLIGEAPVSEYARILASVVYQFNVSDSLQPQRSKNIYFSASDGITPSEQLIVTVQTQEEVDIDIPNIFTPNDDNANDTWRVKLKSGSENLNLLIRVFTKTGVLVYQSSTLDDEWTGKLGDRTLPSDNYFYRIELDGPFSTDVFQGYVTILH